MLTFHVMDPSAIGDTCAKNVETSQLPIPVANAVPRPRICMGIISDMYTHEIGPNDSENTTDTRKMKNTPAIERLVRVPCGF